MNKKKLLVLTGAGISAESGLQTFRDGDGLWENHKIEEVATPEAWRKHPEFVLRFYNMRRAACEAAQPNAAHLGLVALEEHFEVAIVTQNIDDLHERAGSSNVVHLHGEIVKMRSEFNDEILFPYIRDIQLGDLAADGGQLRPHVVWFGESVPNMEIANQLVHQWADIIVLIGSSLAVYPAAGLMTYAPNLVLKYILDPKIPNVSLMQNIVKIEKAATEGIHDLIEMLNFG
jgi:NAD-dependent deacetylase